MSAEAKLDALIGRWIVDYQCRTAWRQFDATGSIDLTFDLFPTVGCKQEAGRKLPAAGGKQDFGEKLPVDEVELRGRLLVDLMRTLTLGGRDPPAPALAGAGARKTPLEEAVELVERLVLETSVGELVGGEEVARLSLGLKRQAVYACCRADNFAQAASVFVRQWTAPGGGERDKEARQRVAQVVSEKNRLDPRLTADPYSGLVDQSRAFLHRVFAVVPPPFLLKAARNVYDKMDVLVETGQHGGEGRGGGVKQELSPPCERGKAEAGTTPAPTKLLFAPKPNGRPMGTDTSCSPMVHAPQRGRGGGRGLSRGGGRGLSRGVGRGLSRGEGGGLSRGRGRGRGRKFGGGLGRGQGGLRGGRIAVSAGSGGGEQGQVDVGSNSESEEREGTSTPSHSSASPTGASSGRGRKRRHTEVGGEGEGQEGGAGERKGGRGTWSVEDEEVIYLGVQRHGVGRWTLISHALPGHSNVDVKDKWRTMVKQGKLELYEKIHGPLPPPSDDKGDA